MRARALIGIQNIPCHRLDANDGKTSPCSKEKFNRMLEHLFTQAIWQPIQYSDKTLKATPWHQCPKNSYSLLRRHHGKESLLPNA